MPIKKCPEGLDKAHLIPSKATQSSLGAQNIVCQNPKINRDSEDERALYKELRKKN